MTTMAQTMAAAYGEAPAPQFLTGPDGHRLVHMLRHQRGDCAIVQMIAANAAAGTSSLARDLALIAAGMPGMRVLLLDLDPPGNRQVTGLRDDGFRVAATRPLIAPPGAAPALSLGDVVIHQLDTEGLHVSETRRPPAGGMADFVAAFPALRKDFTLVLIDTAAIERSYDGILLAPNVDTSLMVVQAEETRTEPARHLRDQILDVGGRIGGVVLNKRRFHIPGFLYRRL